jgi:hypothetical protein
MCEDWEGQGCIMRSSAEGLNSDPCMRIEGTVASKISHHRKLEAHHRKLEGYYGQARYDFYRLYSVSFLAIAQAYGIASTAHRFTLP